MPILVLLLRLFVVFFIFKAMCSKGFGPRAGKEGRKAKQYEEEDIPL